MKTSSVNDSTQGLHGRVAVVTGGSRGIGKAIALELANRGAGVAICARNEHLLSNTRKDLEKAGARVFAQVCDVRNEQSVSEFVERVKHALTGRIDILVNNAGVYRTEPVEQHSLEIWSEVLETNLTGSMLFCRAVLSGMIQQNWGRIINISSVSGRTGEIWGSAYSASKFGLIGFTQSLALETATKGLTVNAVCPGWVATEMSRTQLEDPNWCKLNSMEAKDAQDTACFAVPQNRFIEPDEVASLVAYLASESARGITGQSINICGGLSLQ
jgi:NAD(P)-dependent dehydrogenase (short-subunit alcohol dehydrogenase family)